MTSTYNEKWNFNINYAETSWLTGRCEKVFTPEECREIIKIGESKLLNNAKVATDVVKPDVRESDVRFLHPEIENEWIFDRLESTILNVNDHLFNFELTGLHEGIQFTKYTAPSGHYDAHIDRDSIGFSVRKLSMTLQLSDPNDYEGGDVELYTSLQYPEMAPREQGTAFFFNSLLLHKVTPVTKGTRYSLVAWIAGPKFK
jgi:PKHD-type hydroxylase